MNAVDFFTELGVLKEIRWRPIGAGPTARIVRREGFYVIVDVALPFCGTWIRHSPRMSIPTFLLQYRPTPRLR